jgi:hypothetical protein
MIIGDKLESGGVVQMFSRFLVAARRVSIAA